MLRFRQKGGAPEMAGERPGGEEGTRENHLEDRCAAAGLARDLSRAGSGRSQRQSVALFRGLRRRHHRA